MILDNGKIVKELLKTFNDYLIYKNPLDDSFEIYYAKEDDFHNKYATKVLKITKRDTEHAETLLFSLLKELEIK